VNYVANPVGGALGQLISPLVGDTRQSVRFSNLNFVVVLGWDIDSQSTDPYPRNYVYGSCSAGLSHPKGASHPT